MNKDIQSLCFRLGLSGKDEQSVARSCTDWGEDMIEGILDLMTKEEPRRKGVQKELRIAQFNRLLKGRIKADSQARKDSALMAEIKQWEREWRHSQERGFAADRKQLEDQILELSESDEIMNFAPRNVPQELREDPQALKAKLLEWGIKGASLVHDMIAAAAEADLVEGDIPF